MTPQSYLPWVERVNSAPVIGSVGRCRSIAADKKKLEVRLPPGWLGEHPLTGADLEQEKRYVKAAGLRLWIGEI